jgi:exonuclease VII small subunit
LKHPDTTLTTYKKKTDEHLKHASKTLEKIIEKPLQTYTMSR